MPFAAAANLCPPPAHDGPRPPLGTWMIYRRRALGDYCAVQFYLGPGVVLIGEDAIAGATIAAVRRALPRGLKKQSPDLFAPDGALEVWA